MTYVGVNNDHLNFPISHYFGSYKHFNNKRPYEQAIIKTNYRTSPRGVVSISFNTISVSFMSWDDINSS